MGRLAKLLGKSCTWERVDRREAKIFRASPRRSFGSLCELAGGTCGEIKGGIGRTQVRSLLSGKPALSENRANRPFGLIAPRVNAGREFARESGADFTR